LTEDKLEEYLKKSNGYCAKSVLENGAIASYPTSL
jgi:fructokinase